MRYEHWLRSARPSPWPGAVLCLSASVGWTARDGESAREYASLGSWHIQCCTRSGDSYAVTRSAVGTDADSFWATIKQATLRCRNVWIIGTDFRAAASVLGLWDRMESGNVRISGADPRGKSRGDPLLPLRPQDARGGGRAAEEMGANPAAQRLPGPLAAAEGGARRLHRDARGKGSCVCVLEDPPIVLELMGDGWGSKIIWVDAANYGVLISGANDATGDAAREMASWYCRAASTLHSLGPCGWQATAGSQAMHLYRSVYHAAPTLCHTEPRATALERSGLFGGRCEPFRLGKVAGPVHLLDFRGFYPYLYHCTAVPVRLVSAREIASVAEILADDPAHWWIAKVDIETDSPDYPYRSGNETIFPVGRYTAVLGGAELQHAMRAGVVRRVRSCAVYEAEYALAGYAKALYQVRCAGDAEGRTAQSQWAKRLANCLHGKFAQQDRRWVDCPGAESPWEWAEWYHRLPNDQLERRRVIAGAISREERGGFAHGTVPAIACAIASAGRSRLLAAIIAAGWERVYYCDTDSLIVDDYGLESLTLAGWVRPGEWGYLQHVLSADSADIGGVKRYRIGARTVEAGRPTDAASAQLSDGYARRQRGVRESMSVMQPPADWREAHPWQPGPGRYDRRRGPGGWVAPIELDEWEV